MKKILKNSFLLNILLYILVFTLAFCVLAEASNISPVPSNFLNLDNNSKSRIKILLESKSVAIFPDLAGKVALVTGSSRGIGAETARFLAINKVKVVINGKNLEAVQKMVNEINDAGGKAFGIVADCTNPDQIEKMRIEIEEKFGVVELLFVFAGGSSKPKPIEDIDKNRWEEILNLNLTSKFLTIKYFVPSMKRNGRGVIVLMSSSAGRAPSDCAYDYSTAQAAVPMFTKNLAQQLGSDGIRVNAVAPCSIANETFKAHTLSEKKKDLGLVQVMPPDLSNQLVINKYNEVGKRYAISRMGESKDVAAAALFLASNSASWITGITLDIDGGGTLQLKKMGSGI
ncbi:MAG: SDR family oxidoreductase [Candidatus Paracaedibacteraceae bacterium]|nr:SDR family oxidoreductase [Candidatus Paracaedibacteraceae bacterium]